MKVFSIITFYIIKKTFIIITPLQIVALIIIKIMMIPIIKN